MPVEKEFKKRADSCSALSKNLGSVICDEKCSGSEIRDVFKQETFVGKPVNSDLCLNRDKVPKNVVTNVKHWLLTEGHSQDIRTRCFYNSAFDKRKLQGLLAKGNKYRYLNQGVHKSTFVQCIGKKGFPVLDRKVNSVCTNYDNVDMCSQISLDDKNIAPVGQGSKKQVTPVMNARVNICDTQGGDVNHHSPCEANLHIENVKQCNPNTGHGLAINRCENVDNGQSVFESIVLEEVLTEGKDTIDSQRCENVIDKGGNSFDMSNKTVPLFDIKWSSDDKFVNTLSTRTLKIPSENVEVQQLLEKWRQQTDFTFGFVPVSQFIIPDVHAKGGDTIECPIKCIQALEIVVLRIF